MPGNTFDIGAVGQQAASTAATDLVSGLFGLALEKHNDKRQLNQQTKLQNLQIAGNKQMIDYQKAKDLEMWQATGPTGMMQQLKKAGLNPALMYGMGGGGGTTTGGGAAVAGAEAPKGGGEILAQEGMAMQLQLLQAQKENIEADTENKKADTANKPLQGANVKQQTENLAKQWDLMAIEEDIKGSTSNAAKAIIIQQMRTNYEQMEIAVKENKMTQQQLEAQLALMKAQAGKIAIDNELTKAQTKLTGQQGSKIDAEIEKIRAEVEKITDPQSLANYFEREKIRLMDKGINVAIIKSTLDAVINLGRN